MKQNRTLIHIFILAIAITFIVLFNRSNTKQQQLAESNLERQRTNDPQRIIEPGAPEPQWTPGQPVTKEVMENYAFFTKRPFEVASSSASFEWTANDGRRKDAINQIAHNPIERHKLIEENAFVERRQLIYCRKTLGEIANEARDGGQELKELSIPGFDGKEYKVEVTRTEYQDYDSSGNIYGHLVDRPNSTVVMSFFEDRESYTVISHLDGINFEYIPREAREIILNQIDPTAQRGSTTTCEPILPFDTGAPAKKP